MNVVKNINDSRTNDRSEFRRMIHASLVDLVGKNVTHHRNDLLVTDAQAISTMDTCRFIHVSYISGSHLYELPRLITDNAPIKYLFGKKSPSDIYEGNLDVLATYFGRPEYFGYRHVYAYCDGTNVNIVSKDKAVSIYKHALDLVMCDLRSSLVIGGMV